MHSPERRASGGACRQNGDAPPAERSPCGNMPHAAACGQNSDTPPMPCPGRLYGITGHPLGHSLSPLLHNWGFGQIGWPGVYLAWPLPPEQVEDFVRAVRVLPIHGASVTIPHKEAVLPLLDVVSPRAQRMGAVNTLYWQDNALCGENTDIQGFLAPLHEKGLPVPRTALVLGAGGAARAVLAALHELKVPRVLLTNRNAAKAEALAPHFDALPVHWEDRAHQQADMVINTTPLGMRGQHMNESPFPAQGFAGRGVAYDLVYNPQETRFLREAHAAGWQTQDGLDMFVAQGLAQFLLWTGQRLDAHKARALLRDALNR